MAINEKNIILKGKSSEEKLKVLEQLGDLIEEKYNWINPEKEFTYKVITTIVDAIIVENSTDIQYEMFQTLYNWSWFPCSDEPYDKLLSYIDDITDPSSFILLLRILIASGNLKYLDILKKYEKNKNIEVAKVAKEGIETLLNR
ncbi:hypothetical protein [Fluviicola sp.]|uniref:hypothetical protein n=1 Tax=Fluviicola sp. TaxID=1917219 RepID=UPI0031D21789